MTYLLALAHLLLGLAGAAGLCPLFPAENDRFGVNVSILYGKAIEDYGTEPLNLGWYIDYSTYLAPTEPHGARFWQLLFASGNYPVREAELAALVAANPGSIWVLGNEPDRAYLQDSKTPAEYARFYHDAYAVIKAHDPYARVAIAGVVQPTPLRLRYLDAVLEAYKQFYRRPLPVDIWTTHNFILREVAGEWGADIPPGMEAYAAEGQRYTVYDHARMDLFRQQIRDFRAWLAARGYRDKPLVVTEYGILMPKEYGFDEPLVQQFMLDSFDFFRSAQDAATGYPADDNRLVQGWGWFSLNDKEFDFATYRGYNGNLFDHDSGAIKAIGQAYGAYTAPLAARFARVAAAQLDIAPGYLVPAGAGQITVTATVVNGGNRSGGPVTVQLWDGLPGEGGTVVAAQNLPAVRAHCRERVAVTLVWDAAGLPAGSRDFAVTVEEGGDVQTLTAALYKQAPGAAVRRIWLPGLQVMP